MSTPSDDFMGYAASPFGIHCTICQTPIADRSKCKRVRADGSKENRLNDFLGSHRKPCKFQDKDPPAGFKWKSLAEGLISSMEQICLIFISQPADLAMESFLLPGKNSQLRCGCGVWFETPSKAKTHVQNTKCAFKKVKSTVYRETKCHRKVTIKTIDRLKQELTADAGSEPASQVGTLHINQAPVSSTALSFGGYGAAIPRAPSQPGASLLPMPGGDLASQIPAILGASAQQAASLLPMPGGDLTSKITAILGASAQQAANPLPAPGTDLMSQITATAISNPSQLATNSSISRLLSNLTHPTALQSVLHQLNAFPTNSGQHATGTMQVPAIASFPAGHMNHPVGATELPYSTNPTPRATPYLQQGMEPQRPNMSFDAQQVHLEPDHRNRMREELEQLFENFGNDGELGISEERANSVLEGTIPLYSSDEFRAKVLQDFLPNSEKDTAEIQIRFFQSYFNAIGNIDDVEEGKKLFRQKIIEELGLFGKNGETLEADGDGDYFVAYEEEDEDEEVEGQHSNGRGSDDPLSCLAYNASGLAVDGLLNVLLDAAAIWIHDKARGDVARVPPTVRAAFQKLSQTLEDVDGFNHHGVFTMRHNTTTLAQELQRVLTWAYNSDTVRTSRLKEVIRKFVSKADGDHKTAVDYLVASAEIPTFLVSFLLHKPETYRADPPIIRYVAIRSFRENLSGGKLMLRTAGQNASVAAAILSLLRTALCSKLVAIQEDISWVQTRITSLVRSGSPSSVVAQRITTCRQIHNAKVPNGRDYQVDAEFNIHVGALTFRREISSQLIPILVEKATKELDNLFVPGSWETLLDLSQAYPLNEKTLKFNFRPDAEVHCILRNDAPNKTTSLKRLIGVLAFCVYGMGGGSSRGTEILEPSPDHFKVVGPRYNFYSKPCRKKGRLLTKEPGRLQYRLTEVLSRIFAMFITFLRDDPEIRESLSASEELLFLVPRAEAQKEMLLMAGEIFGLKKVQLLDLRHFFTVVADVVSNSRRWDRDPGKVRSSFYEYSLLI